MKPCIHYDPPTYCQLHGRMRICHEGCPDRSDGKTDRGRHERKVDEERKTKGEQRA